MGLSKSSTIKLAHSMRSLDFTSQLNNIRCPVTILCGKKDTANLKASKKLKNCYPKLLCTSFQMQDMKNGVLAQFTTQREILFAGQPFQAPESYLRNAELYEEGQTGNYNMLDGGLNNNLLCARI